MYGPLTMPLDVFDRLLRPLRRRPVTGPYPGEAPDLPPAARGLPELDPVRCDGRAACVTACPTGAISLTDSTWSLDAGACIFCAACARACPTGAIRLGSQIELAVRERADLVVVRDWRADR
jgi:formate hydrogenlyase subunit 6/NADH:ubiquinone oxidoreductase subunit I